MRYQEQCFGDGFKEPYCLLFRDGIAALPLVAFWILIPSYTRIVRNNEPELRAPKYFWAHLIFQVLLLVDNAVFGALYFNQSDHFLPLLRFFQVLSYANCCIWFSLLSKRLHSIHPSFCFIFLVLLVLKAVQLLILAFESTVDAGVIAEFVLLMAETALLSGSTKRLAENEEKAKLTPEEKSSFISKIFFCWLNPLIRTGAKDSLTNENLHNLNQNATSEWLYTRWRDEFRKAKEKNLGTVRETSIVWPFIRIQKATIITLTLARLIADVVHYLNPILLKQLIDYVSLHDQPLSFGIAIACIMFLSATTRSLLQNYQIAGMCRQAVYYQTVLSNAILHKILKLSPSARSNRTAGEILNHAAVDIEIIVHSIPYLQNMWSVPFQVTLAMTMLAITLGWAAGAGVIIMILFVPLNFLTSRFIKTSQQKQMKIKDERTKLSNEMLNGIKVVKLYAWEESFEEQINKLRAKEVKMFRNVCILSRIVDVANAASPFLVAIGSFTCYVLWSPDENGLTPSVAFVALVIFNQLRQPMRMVANLINTLVQARVSNKRLRQFLNDEEMESKTEVALGNAIVFKNATLNWKGPMNPPVLRDLCATIKPGQLIAIVGSVGGGKSSLLSAVLDEMVLLEGRVKIGGSIAYVPQHSWIFNKSIKENILFGNEYSKYFYNQVVGSCQLRPDFKHFQQGEQTMVGENGITLSGGQKARISLARAVYQEKDIYLLDDPLSAVDAHVGRALFDKVIGPEGLLRSKTRVLVTHNLQYTKYVDSIYVIEDGQIVQHGSFEDIAHLEGPFGRLWAECENPEEAENAEELDDVVPEDVTPPEIIEKTEAVKKVDRTNSHISEKSEKSQKPENPENVQLGRVKKSVYNLYIRTMGIFNTSAFFIFFISHFTVMIMRSLWLSDWSNENAELKKRGGVSGNSSYEDEMISVETRLIVYAGFGGLEMLLLALAFTVLTIGSLRASYRLHAPLIHSLLRAPISFFDTTPIGRIINRLSRDLDVIDKLQDNIRMCTQTLLNACMILVLISISTPIFLLCAAPLILIYYFVMIYYIPTSRQLKRLESANRSPILSTIAESIHGASSIRAFDKTDRTTSALASNVDKFAQCRYLSHMSNRWLATRLELLGNTTVLFASLSATLSTKYFGLTPGMAGLSVSYALTITEVLNICVRAVSEIESNIVSVERVNEYQKLEPEAPWIVEGSLENEEKWPSKGKIELNKFSMRYRKNLPMVLKEIDLKIEGGERIGIIGRTGSGKSSLTMALYRMIEAESGTIRIDDVEIDSIGLHQLRSKLIIIPQEPVVFSGTLRFNLDPFNQYLDDQIWRCLDICQLKQFAQEDEKTLDRHIAEGGKNMSVGERQLLCLCRALLRGARIVILDEATASVDTVTDGIVQRAIRQHFPQSTTISIAHRLDTIVDSDRIVVLDAGRVAEFDTPSNLLLNPDSLYSQLLNEKNRKQ
ncbi:hypothetical protein GCK72_010833 [Caenorhabditis remanei]|uniref:Uncharacterized protein n=1 Tax=Caenorhabditis remanei TaxID=31234 RepID=A0A6A5H6Q5_CAERE|nr:hypothetical protein GCK72_010833 [Caenorhabditis remanei]KAF1762571.1 hypothetical protein GCK72_010833 [Caenorhabditis remanei]